MIAQALASEWLKLSKNRWTMFWAWGFIPALALLTGILIETFSRTTPGGAILGAAAPVSATLDGLGAYGNVVVRLFPIAGAATLFAGEYRWETWRAILTRNGRTAIMLAKLCVFAVAAAISILLCGAAGLLTGLYEGALFGNFIWPSVGASAVILALRVGFAASFLQLMATVGVVMLIAMLSRSMIAAIIGGVGVFLVCDLLSVYMRVRLPSASEIMALLPNIAGEALRQLASGIAGDPDALGLHLALPGAAALTLCCVVLSAAAIYLFRRQDLSRE